jgi:hypothetical protein
MLTNKPRVLHRHQLIALDEELARSAPRAILGVYHNVCHRPTDWDNGRKIRKVSGRVQRP